MFQVIHSDHPVLYDHATSINHDDKKARDASLTCSCRLINIMTDRKFHESMSQSISFFAETAVAFYRMIFLFSWIKRDEISFSTITLNRSLC